MPQNPWILPIICLIVAVFAVSDVVRERVPDSFWALIAADVQWRVAQAIAKRSMRPLLHRKPRPSG